MTAGIEKGASGNTVRAAAIQMSSSASVTQNLALADRLLTEAQEAGCRFAALPENFAFMGKRNADKLAVAEVPGCGPIQDFLAEISNRLKMWIVAGSVNIRSDDPDRCYGTSLLYDSHGKVVGRYNKIHLFDVSLPGNNQRYQESAVLKHGSDVVSLPSVIGRLGLTICYDVRFPELYRHLVDDGATVFTVPAAFTMDTGKAHWQTLLRARAIENLCYVIAPGQHGQHADGRTTYGNTMIIDPWGQVLAQQESGDAVVLADIETELPLRLRESFPVLHHRRL